jgi:GAF domain-containing protein
LNPRGAERREPIGSREPFGRLEPATKSARYGRIAAQLEGLFSKTRDPVARMATAAALLHAKMPGLLWTGWYLLRDGELTVGPYQGPVACLVLAAHAGVCWACVDRGEAVVVPDVHAFPGHVACDPRSRSEIVVSLCDASGEVAGVLDLDSAEPAHFDEVDREGLERVAAMIYR